MLKRRKFTAQFKLRVCREIEAKLKTATQATREYELSEGLIAKWLQIYRKDPTNAFSSSANEVQTIKAKVSQLENALGRKTLENEILQKALDMLDVKKGGYTR